MNEISTAFSIPELLYEEGSFGVFLLVTIILGGGTAALAGGGFGLLRAARSAAGAGAVVM